MYSHVPAPLPFLEQGYDYSRSAWAFEITGQSRTITEVELDLYAEDWLGGGFVNTVLNMYSTSNIPGETNLFQPLFIHLP